MKHAIFKKRRPQLHEAARIFVPHSSWAQEVQSAPSGKRLLPEEFWARLDL